MDLAEAQNKIQTKMAEMQKELFEVGRQLFEEGSRDIFVKYPEVADFSWTQYTPYFNDGDECVFGVNEYFTVNLRDGGILEDVYDSPYAREKKIERGESLDLSDHLGQDLSGLIGSIPPETMKSIFGDHVRVTITPEGIETEEYEHE